jgi:alpha-beta hydrolase superfamily lysophospholipase
VVAPAIATDALLMPDGARLPLHAWLPQGPPRAVLLALHGFNDYSVDFMEDAAPRFAAAGIAVYAYDQRGFGAAPNRGIWPGARTLVADAGTAARLIKARHPGLPLFMLGESMGAAVIILAASGPAPPPAAGYLLLAPALWGRAGMNAAMRWGLWLASRTIPVVGFRGGVAGITPTDNEAALRRWMNDPLTLKSTRVDAAHGLVDLMDAAVGMLPGGGRCGPGADTGALRRTGPDRPDARRPARPDRAAGGRAGAHRLLPQGLPPVAAGQGCVSGGGGHPGLDGGTRRALALRRRPRRAGLGGGGGTLIGRACCRALSPKQIAEGRAQPGASTDKRQSLQQDLQRS